MRHEIIIYTPRSLKMWAGRRLRIRRWTMHSAECSCGMFRMSCTHISILDNAARLHKNGEL